MVVLQHQDVRVPRQHPAQLGAAEVVERAAEGILTSGGHQHRTGAPAEGTLQVVGEHAPGVDPDRLRPEGHRPEQVEDRRVDGVLHRHAVAGPEIGLEDPFDAIDGAAHDGDVGGVQPVGAEALPREVGQVGVNHGRAVDGGSARQGCQGPAPVRQELGIGLALGQVAKTWAGPRRDSRVKGGARRDRGSRAARPDRQPATAQLPVGCRDGRRAHPQLARHPADGGQVLPRLEPSVTDRSLDRGGDADRSPPGHVE
jgi:hypothetical protein